MNLVAMIRERARHYRCVSCWQLLGANCQVNILAQSEGHCTAEVTCGKCAFSFIAVFAVKRRKHPEGLPKNISEPISSDELLDVHEYLTSSTASLKDLFRLPTSHP